MRCSWPASAAAQRGRGWTHHAGLHKVSHRQVPAGGLAVAGVARALALEVHSHTQGEGEVQAPRACAAIRQQGLLPSRPAGWRPHLEGGEGGAGGAEGGGHHRHRVVGGALQVAVILCGWRKAGEERAWVRKGAAGMHREARWAWGAAARAGGTAARGALQLATRLHGLRHHYKNARVRPPPATRGSSSN